MSMREYKRGYDHDTTAIMTTMIIVIMTINVPSHIQPHIAESVKQFAILALNGSAEKGIAQPGPAVRRLAT